MPMKAHAIRACHRGDRRFGGVPDGQLEVRQSEAQAVIFSMATQESSASAVTTWENENPFFLNSSLQAMCMALFCDSRSGVLMAGILVDLSAGSEPRGRLSLHNRRHPHVRHRSRGFSCSGCLLQQWKHFRKSARILKVVAIKIQVL